LEEKVNKNFVDGKNASMVFAQKSEMLPSILAGSGRTLTGSVELRRSGAMLVRQPIL